MEDYVIKYASSKISNLFTQINYLGGKNYPFEFIDPICAMIKLSLLYYKDVGTKISIKNNTIMIQEYSTFQGLQRFMNSDERDQIYHLKVPIFYFRGIVLQFIISEHINDSVPFLTIINNLVIQGLKKLKLTYEMDNKSEFLIKNCLEDYIKILSTNYSKYDYELEIEKINKQTLFAIYNECIKLWTLNDFNILTELFKLTENEDNLKIKNQFSNCINEFVIAKNLIIDKIRPD